MRDEQTPDVMGHPLPLKLEMAQARWSVRGNIRLNGRAEVVSIKDAVSSSYSCFLCCPNTFGSGWISPDNCPSTTAGGTVEFTAFEEDTNGAYCGWNFEPFPVGASWDSSNQSVATIDYDGVATGISPGFTNISCYWTTYRWVWDDIDESCNEDVEPFEADGGCMSVNPQPHIVFSGSGIPLKNGDPPANTWPSYPNSVTMHADTDFAGGTYLWTTTSDKVKLTNEQTDTVTVTSLKPSIEEGDVQIKVTQTVEGESGDDQISTTVQQPSSLTYVAAGSSSNTITIKCSPTVVEDCCDTNSTGIQRDINWQLMDQKGQPMKLAIPGSDSGTYDSTHNACGLTTFRGTPPALKELTDSTGIWSHHYWFCTGNCACTTNGTQNYTFNGFSISAHFVYTCSTITVDGH